MSKNFSELEAAMSPEQIRRSDEKYERCLQEMAAHKLHAAQRYTRLQLAHTLGIRGRALMRLQRSADVYVSTLTRFIEAMGGSLEIRVVFPDGEVTVTQFQEPRENLPA
jgi:hypothetical protein